MKDANCYGFPQQTVAAIVKLPKEPVHRLRDPFVRFLHIEALGGAVPATFYHRRTVSVEFSLGRAFREHLGDADRAFALAQRILLVR